MTVPFFQPSALDTLKALKPYVKNGHVVVDTPALDKSGHVPTHRLDQPTNRLPSESFPQYEQRVLHQTSWSPDTAATSMLGAVDPDVQSAAQRMMTDASKAGVRLTPVETKRSQERQEMLFQKGRTAPGSVVTWTLTSDHTPGRAIDFDEHSANWLQKNAPTYGFNVMGAMDPGHVSMPSAAPMSALDRLKLLKGSP